MGERPSPGFEVVMLIAIILFVFIALCTGAYIRQRQTNSQNDLVVNDRNEIIEGSVKSNQHPLSNYNRPQPTWYKR